MPSPTIIVPLRTWSATTRSETSDRVSRPYLVLVRSAARSRIRHMVSIS